MAISMMNDILPMLVLLGVAQQLYAGPVEPHQNIRQRRSPWTDNLLAGRGYNFLYPSRHAVHHNYKNSAQLYTAMTFGRGHVVTFDGKYYRIPDDLSRECPHILARDHRALGFMILRNRNSISVYTSHTVVTLHVNNKVEVNNTGSYRDLPVISWDSTISVTHNNKAVVIQTQMGILIECDINHKDCLYELNGNYYNHTIGLLGTNDDDVSNDFLLRSGEIASSTQEFINYYELTGLRQCRLDTAPQVPPTCRSHRHRHTCQRLFLNQDSPMASCHGVVRTDAFMDACLFEANSCDTHKDLKICDVARAYSKMCRAHGVQVVQPGQCGNCHHHEIGSRWSQKPHRKMDIVIATSLNQELNTGDQTIGDVIYRAFNDIEMNIRKNIGLQNLRVGLLGYGGLDSLEDPHVYTVQGESFTRHYNSGIWKETLQSLENTGDMNSDPLEAIDTVLDYPFREDAIKMVLLILDSNKPNLFPDIQSLIMKMQSQGVILNVLAQSYPHLQSQRVQGILGNSQLLLGPLANRGSSIHYTSDFPNDQIGELVEITNGAIFDLNDIVISDGHILRHLNEQFINQISRTLTTCQSCECHMTSDGPMPVCQQSSCVS